MTAIIDGHDSSAKIQGLFINFDIQARVDLTETIDGTFKFCIDYSYSGTRCGRDDVSVPVQGNISKIDDVGSGISIGYTISNWSVTSSHVQCDLTAYIEYQWFPPIAPCYLFKDQRFTGPRGAKKTTTSSHSSSQRAP